MRVEIETITPERAAALLETAKTAGQRQRHLSRTRVARLVHAIQAGQWRVTHQGIALDENGVLIDGQHRLTAVVEAELPVRIAVTYDADPETFDVIDTGRARTVKDAAQIAGFANPTRATALTRMLMAVRDITGTTKTVLTNEYTASDVLAVMNDDDTMNLVEKVITPSAQAAKGVGRFGAQNWFGVAFIQILESGADEERLQEFVEKIRHGLMLEEGDPIAALRKAHIGATQLWNMPVPARQTAGAAMTIRAWNDWINEKKRTQFRFVVGTDIFPKVAAPKAIPAEEEGVQADIDAA